MSSFSKEFDAVTIETDGTTVRIDGTSRVDGHLVPEPPSAQIYVALVDLPEQPLLALAVLTGAKWSASFPDAAQRLANVQHVRCIGLGLSLTEPPVVWEQLLEVDLK
jgi:hypothetical protein